VEARKMAKKKIMSNEVFEISEEMMSNDFELKELELKSEKYPKRGT
jgi:hypothetical protein